MGCPSLISGCLASNEYALGIASLSLLGRCLSDEPNYGKFIQVASGSEANEGILKGLSHWGCPDSKEQASLTWGTLMSSSAGVDFPLLS